MSEDMKEKIFCIVAKENLKQSYIRKTDVGITMAIKRDYKMLCDIFEEVNQ
jgi:hypothetical protein